MFFSHVQSKRKHFKECSRMAFFARAQTRTLSKSEHFARLSWTLSHIHALYARWLWHCSTHTHVRSDQRSHTKAACKMLKKCGLCYSKHMHFLLQFFQHFVDLPVVFLQEHKRPQKPTKSNKLYGSFETNSLRQFSLYTMLIGNNSNKDQWMRNRASCGQWGHFVYWCLLHPLPAMTVR